MNITAVQRFTLLDFPKKTACIVFTPGCDFRCGYCHNPEFVLPEKIAQIAKSFIPERNFFSFLERRKNLLDGVVISGGEPTIQPDLSGFMQKIKEMGFQIKLDTNGNRPEVVEQLYKSEFINYVAMDVKTSLEDYPRLVGPRVKKENIAKSIEFIKNSGLEYEFRTTLIREWHTPEILQQLADLVAGAKLLALQTFRPGNTLEKTFEQFHPFPHEEMEKIAQTVFSHRVQKVVIR